MAANAIIPAGAFTPAVLSTYLGSTDSRDKLVKGLGGIFKILGALTGNPAHGKMAASCSDARSFMRLLVCLGNVKKLEDAVKGDLGPRGVLWILRVLFDGIFSSLDNIAFIGNYFHPKDPALLRISATGRASLFWGYVFAVMVDAIDLSRLTNKKARINKALVMTRNTFDMLSTIGNVFPVDIGATNGAILAVASAAIATREQLTAAYEKTSKTA